MKFRVDYLGVKGDTLYIDVHADSEDEAREQALYELESEIQTITYVREL